MVSAIAASSEECPRLRLSQKLQEASWQIIYLQPSSELPLRLLGTWHEVVFEKQHQLREHIQHVTLRMEAALGIAGSWQERIRHQYANVMSWDDWDKTRGDEPLVISLPFDTSLLVTKSHF